MARVEAKDRELTIAALAPDTWDASAALSGRHFGYDGRRFEQAGFSCVRPKGTRNCVMRIEVS